MAAKETRTQYDWGGTGLIQHMDVRQQGEYAVAYIYADNAPEAAQSRHQVLTTLKNAGFSTVADYHNDTFALRVSGIKSADQLLSVLSQKGLADAPKSVTSPPVEKPPEVKGLWPNIRANSLRLAGIFYSMGNVVYLASGLARNHEKGKEGKPVYGQIGSALTWGAGDILVATIGGHDNASRQYTALLNKLNRHYTKEGVQVSAATALHTETANNHKTMGERAYDFVHTYLNPIKCASEVVAGFFYFNAGKQQNNVWKQRTAITFGLGFSASALIPEKKIDEEKYEKAGAIERLWMRIQSNPLSIGGISGYSNTIFTTVGAFKEGQRYKKRDSLVLAPGEKPPSKYYQLDYAAPAVMLFGNSFYAMSKKNTSGDIKTQETVSDVYAIAAQVVNSQPEKMRENVLQSTARFLWERPEIKDSKEQVIIRLRQQMELQKKNPWSEHLQTEYAPHPASAEPANTPTKRIHTEKSEHDQVIRAEAPALSIS